MFQMLGSVSTLVASKVGRVTAPDAVDGNWDQLATGQDGTLHVLKGEKMLSVQVTNRRLRASETQCNFVRAALERF